jgi:hypothetical protein
MLCIFLSYTNGDPICDALTEALVTRLDRPSCSSVFLDKKNIEPGDDWRQRIYVALARCDAAILLISPCALDDGKVWVAYETHILLWRKATFEPNLKIVPVLLGGLTLDMLEKDDRFRDQNLRELQTLSLNFDTSEAATIAEAASKVVDSIAGLVASERKVDEEAKVFAQYLGLAADRELLRAVLKEAGLPDLETDPWLLDRDPSGDFMLRLFEAEPNQILNALGALTRAHPERSEVFFKLGMTLLARGVHPAAAEVISKTIDDANAGKVTATLVLNSARIEVGELYLCRAWGKLGLPTWFLPRCDGIAGEGAESDLERAVVIDFCNRYLSRGDPARAPGVPYQLRLARVHERMRQWAQRSYSFIMSQGVHQRNGHCLLKRLFPEAQVIAHADVGPPLSQAEFPEPGFRVILPALEPKQDNALWAHRENLRSEIDLAKGDNS